MSGNVDYSSGSNGIDYAKENPEIVDPDNYNLARRFKQIHDARERFPEVKREESKRVAKDEKAGGITKGRYRQIVSDALIDYLIEVEPLMRNENLEHGDVYWSEKNIGEDGAGNQITLGLIVDQNGYVHDESGNRVPLPIPMSQKAYRMANRFVADAGIGLDIDTGLPIERGFDSTGMADEGSDAGEVSVSVDD